MPDHDPTEQPDDATEPGAASPDVDDTPPPAAEPDHDDTGDGGESPHHRETAKYRTKLREVETDRDGLAAQLDAMRRAEVTRVAGGRLARGEDLFVHQGDDLAKFLAEDGSVDSGKVTEAVAELVEQRPYLAARRFAGHADGGVRGTPARPRPRMGSIFTGTDGA